VLANHWGECVNRRGVLTGLLTGGIGNKIEGIWTLKPLLAVFNSIYLFIYLVFRDRVSLYSPGCPGTHFVEQAGLELRNLPASASQVLGLKVCATMSG
jgi:hypothetical protein